MLSKRLAQDAAVKLDLRTAVLCIQVGKGQGVSNTRAIYQPFIPGGPPASRPRTNNLVSPQPDVVQFYPDGSLWFELKDRTHSRAK